MKANGLLRALVVDDSAFSRRTIVRMLEHSPLVETTDWAPDGQAALAKALAEPYDLITLDLEMPRMDGFTFLRLLMAQRPAPVVVVSGRRESEDVFRALELGAIDFVAKPTRRAAPELATIEHELLQKVRSIRELRLDRVGGLGRAAPSHAVVHPPLAPHRVVAIGSSTGGPAALQRLFSAFRTPPDCAFVVCQHMPAGFTHSFAKRLGAETSFRACEAGAGMRIEPGTILVAPGGSHLEFAAEGNGVVTRIAPPGEGERYTPAVDRMFVSAAKHFGPDLLAVVLTGMGDDGAAGALAVKRAGGNVIAESAETAVIFGMPQQAIRSGAVDAVLPLHEIPQVIASACERARRTQSGSSA